MATGAAYTYETRTHADPLGIVAGWVCLWAGWCLPLWLKHTTWRCYLDHTRIAYRLVGTRRWAVSPETLGEMVDAGGRVDDPR